MNKETRSNRFKQSLIPKNGSKQKMAWPYCVSTTRQLSPFAGREARIGRQRALLLAHPQWLNRAAGYSFK